MKITKFFRSLFFIFLITAFVYGQSGFSKAEIQALNSHTGKINDLGEKVGEFQEADFPTGSVDMFIDTSQPIGKEAFQRVEKLYSLNDEISLPNVKGTGDLFYNSNSSFMFFYNEETGILVKMNCYTGKEFNLLSNWSILPEKPRRLPEPPRGGY